MIMVIVIMFMIMSITTFFIMMVMLRFKKNHPDHSMCWTRHGEDGFYSVVDAHNHFRWGKNSPLAIRLTDPPPRQAFWRSPCSLGDLHWLAEVARHPLQHHAWHRTEARSQVRIKFYCSPKRAQRLTITKTKFPHFINQERTIAIQFAYWQLAAQKIPI